MAFSSLSMDLREGWKQTSEGTTWDQLPAELKHAFERVSEEGPFWADTGSASSSDPQGSQQSQQGPTSPAKQDEKDDQSESSSDKKDKKCRKKKE